MPDNKGFAQYDPAEVQIIVDGNPLSGYADGTFCEIEFDEQQWNKVVGADGLVSRSKTNSYSGTITVTLLQTSNGNDILSALWNKDRRSNTGVFSVLIKDSLGRTRASAEKGWIQQIPNQTFSKETESREWTIDCANLFVTVGGNQL